MTSAELVAHLYERGARLALDGDRVRVSAPRGAITDEVWAELAARKEELRQWLQRTTDGAATPRPSLGRRSIPDRLPLSYPQQRLWLIDQVQGSSSEYNVPTALRLRGDIDCGVLERTINAIVVRHESLRTHFAQVDGEPIQVIEPYLRIPLPVDDLSSLSRAAQDEAVSAALRREWETPFDLARGPVIRVRLLRVCDREHVLIRTLHHIVSDGWSGSIFDRELVTLYESFREGRENPLAPVPVQYADFTLWQRQCLDEPTLEHQVAYWRRQLEGIPEQLALPTDRPRPQAPTYVADMYRAPLGAIEVAALERFAHANQATVFMLLVAALGVLLQRYSGQDDIVIGSPIANRQDPQLEQLIGFFANTLALRVRLHHDRTFRSLIAEVRQTTLDAYLHQDLPFARVVEELAPARRVNSTPLFQTVITMQNAPSGPQHLAGLDIEPVVDGELRVRFDLEFHVAPDGRGGLDLVWAFKRDLFDRWRIEQMARHFSTLLAAAAESPDEPLDRLEMLAHSEREMLATPAIPLAAPDRSLPASFEEQAARAPDAVALEDAGTFTSYGELNRAANRLAHYLVALGIGPESVVGVALERSTDMVVAVLAVLKAGGAYLPLDITLPNRRLADIVDDAAPALIITRASVAHSLPTWFEVVLDDPDLCDSLEEAPQHDPGDRDRVTPVRPDHPAYVIYTSGSTGAPKGVVVSRRELSRYLSWAAVRYCVDEGDGAPVNTPLAFDATVTSLLLPLTAGRPVILIPEASQIEALADLLASGRDLTLVKLTPAHLDALRAILGARATSVRARAFVVGGEALAGGVADFWRQRVPGLRIFNEYGPTECVVGCCVHELDRSARVVGDVPIGTPPRGTRLYVLDNRLRLVPVGVPGELYIGGDQVSNGYRHRRSLTAERFVADPFAEAAGRRMYRTGDVVRRRPDGTLDYLGRSDRQVKIRGFRVELGEIETVLGSLPTVSQAAVVLREDLPGHTQLIAYLVPVSASHSDLAAGVRAQLAERLPDYMVPSSFVILDALPLTANGKVDRAALPAPGRQQDGYRAPRTSAEVALCRAFETVLGVERVGLDDRFFELGGDSILSILLVTRARDAGLELTAADVFQHQTAEALARVARIADDRGQAPLDSEERIGDLPPTPIMRWLFERKGPIDSVSQSMVVRTPSELTESALVVLLQEVLDTHDAMRLCAEVRGDEWHLRVLPPGAIRAAACVTTVDLGRAPDDQRAALMHSEATTAGRRLNVDTGQLFQAVRFLGVDGDPLLLIVHHLAIDAVSWHLLLTDLSTAWNAMSAGEAPRLTAERTPFRTWARELASRTDTWLDDFPRWEETLTAGGALVPGAVIETHVDTVRSAQQLTMELPEDVTARLLTTATQAFHATVSDVLLACLAVAFETWRRRIDDRSDDFTLVDVEGHGRDALLDSGSGRPALPGRALGEAMDVSLTVGWFTTLYPVRLGVPELDLGDALRGGPAIGQALKLIKEQSRAAARGSAGYGVLRYVNTDTASRLAALPQAQVGFNYVGRIEVDRNTPWSPMRVAGDLNPAFAPDLPLAHLLDINVVALDDDDGTSLRATWTWAGRHVSRQAIEALAAAWQDALGALARHVDRPGAGGHTGSDFPRVAIDQADIEAIEARVGAIDDLLPLSPLQEGLLFHAVYDDSGPDIYTVQLVVEFGGSVHAPQLRAAAEALLRRHPNLRAQVHQRVEGRPIHVIPRMVHLPWTEIDLRQSLDRARACEDVIQTDRRRRFDVEREPLIRFTLVRLEDQRYVLVLAHHHILFDGWSTPLVFSELLTLYRTGNPESLDVVRPYSDYLDWLGRQDRGAAVEAWRSYLAGVDEPTRLSRPGPRGASASVLPESWAGELSREDSLRLSAMARARGVTLNMVVQAVWAWLLSRLTVRADVVFGAIVSGRPADVPGVERMIGLFINTLPVRVRVHPGARLSTLIRDLHESQVQLLPHQHVGLAEIQRAAAASDLFDTLVVFENYHLDREALAEAVGDLRVIRAEGRDAAHYPLSVIVAPGRSLKVRFDYDPSRFDRSRVDEIARRFIRLLRAAAADVDAPLFQMPLLDASERRLLSEFGTGAPPQGADAPLPELFERQVARTPAAVAVLCGTDSISYADLNRQANRIAHALIARGVGSGSIVAIGMPPSADMIAALLGTLKAGAAYLPLDVESPEARLARILADAAPALLLRSLDSLDLASRPSADPSAEDRLRPRLLDDAAYLIYTSGSTGTPKGVLVRHRELTQYIGWAMRRYDVDRGSGAPLSTPLPFDATMTSLFLPLLAGRPVHVLPERELIPALGDLLSTGAELTLVKTTPSHLEALRGLLGERAALVRARRFVVGGEALTGPVARFWLERAPHLRIVNEYGPTEAVVGCCTFELDQSSSVTADVPIGRPTPGTRLYVLDDHLEPLPIGVSGELYIGGYQVASGYHRHASLTAERFVADPYAAAPGLRMYRTGDAARWRDDGILEYLGRVDDQVKIRGYRIEPAEIEATLVAHAEVAQAAVTARTTRSGARQLIAYVVPSPGHRPRVDDLRALLESRLPAYMVPSAIVPLDAMPVTVNGKIDRKALPNPGASRERGRVPHTDVEKRLAALFADVLSVDEVFLDDGFFALGGDSILSMLLVSRARAAGLHLTPRDIFERQTVESLASVVRASGSLVRWRADAAIGVIPPTPLMRRLLQYGAVLNRFNQSMLISLPGELTRADLAAVLQAIIDRHDTLRLQIDGEVVTARPVGSVDAAQRITHLDLSDCAPEAARELMRTAALAAGSRLDPSNGRIVEAVWFTSPGASSLFLAIHHFAVDGVSWRILLADLAAAWDGISRGEPPTFEPETTPFRVWAQHLQERAGSVVHHLARWESQLAGAVPVTPDVRLDPDRDTLETAGQLSAQLSADETAALLTHVTAAFHAGAHEVVLTAFALAALAWKPRHEEANSIVVDIEGHGRQAPPDSSSGRPERRRDGLGDALDVSRTIGWFTELFPVRLDLHGIDVDAALAGGPTAGLALKRIKEQLRSVPDGGSFGLLRYANGETAERLALLPAPQIGFNYLGRIAAGRSAAWEASADTVAFGAGFDPRMPLAHVLDLNAVVLEGPDGARLSVDLIWAGRHVSEADARELLRLWRLALGGLRVAVESGAGGHTPADFPLVSLSQARVEELESTFGPVADVLPLSPLQQGFLFHATFDETAPDVYAVQTTIEFDSPVDPSRLRAAVVALLRRHPNLRASFHHDGIGPPVQVIPREVVTVWRHLNVCGNDDAVSRCQRLAAEDRLARFDLTRGPLVRCLLVDLDTTRPVFVFTHHHALLDGWSMPLVFRDLLSLYHSNGDDAALPCPPLYSDYLRWLAMQDREAALDGWQKYLRGVEEPTRLAPRSGKPDHLPESLHVELSATATAGLTRIARERGLTLNSVVQAVWALTLARSTGRDDVVFGATVSGRPADLPGAEEMVGLFINTVPVRVRVRGGATLTTLATGLRDDQASLIAHQHVSLTEIVSAAGQRELFDTLFVFENYPLDRAALVEALGDLRVTSVEARDATHYPLTVIVVPGDRLRIRIDYDAQLFTLPDASTIGERLVRLMEAASASPDAPLHRLAMLAPEENRMLIDGWNPIAVDAPETTVPALFDEQAARTPDAVAIVSDAGSITFDELNGRANRLAHELRRQGTGPGALVAVSLPRSMEMVVALLGVMKAGAAYLPLDPDLPPARIAQLVTDARPALVLHSADVASPHDASPVPEPAALFPGHAAYVIYTSGSTGVPKGVVVSHQELTTYLRWACEFYEADRGEGAPVNTPLAFDATVTSLFVPLLSGRPIFLIPEQDQINELRRLVSDGREFTLVKATPAHLEALRALVGARGTDVRVRTLVVGGEALPASLAGFWRDRIPGVRVINEYGPTEAVVGCCVHEMRAEDDRCLDVPIGRPSPNTRLYVLDAMLELAPAGVAGELYIGGTQLASGYWGRAAMTAERFVVDPYSPRAGARMYRTGDVARRREDGTLEYLGRSDRQIKIRGFRVEPGEVEAALTAMPGVASAAVVLRRDDPAGASLVAYVVPRPGRAVVPDELRRELAERLPAYMVPPIVVPLESIPLTANGKIDRGALPVPAHVVGAVRAPRSAEEQIACDLFAEVLKVERVGIDGDFFALGGHSLTAIQLVSRIRATLGREIAVRALFESPTPAGVAAALHGAPGAPQRVAAVTRPNELPLSYAQQRLWFLYQMQGATATYNIPLAFRLVGPLDRPALESALNDVVARHEALRTLIVERDGVPFQKVLSPGEARFGLPVERVAANALSTRIAEAAAVAIELNSQTPLVVSLFELGPEEHVLSCVFHHIASDGWSMGLFGRDLAAAYNAREAGSAPSFDDLPVQYADYALWQRAVLGDAKDPESRLGRQLTFWREALAEAPEALTLPFDRPRPPFPSHRGGNVVVDIEAALHARLIDLSRSSGATLFMVLQAGIASLLARMGAGDDIPIGTAVAGRNDPALENLVGFFVNVLVLRTDLAGDPRFSEIVDRVKAFHLDAYECHDVPFEQLVEALQPERTLARHPLFQVMLTLQNVPVSTAPLAGLTATIEQFDASTAKFDLTFDLTENLGPRHEPRGITGVLGYSLDLFDAGTAETIVRRLVRLLAAAAAAPDQRLHRLPFLDRTERDVVLERFNDTARPLPQESVAGLFELQVSARPGAPAVITDSDTISYGDLNRRANRLARRLRALGVEQDQLVGIDIDRSIERIVALLAILKAGAAYLPLDPDAPDERIRTIVDDATLEHVITSADKCGRWMPMVPCVLTEADASSEEPHNLAIVLPPTAAAYVNYTSGSTGQPKGVLVPHVAVVRLVCNPNYVTLDRSSRALHMAPLSFDAATFEIWGPLLNGGVLAIMSPGSPSVEDIGAVLERHGVNTLWLTAGLFNEVVEQALNSLGPVTQLLAGGDVLSLESVDRVRRAHPACQVINGYGPTENTTFSCCYPVPSSAALEGTVPIGAPIANTRAYVLDSRLSPVPVGVTGELYVSGEGLARGYLRRRAMTAERFVPDPYAVTPGARMYRTGDLARWRPDGILEFQGRTDAQVKIRGFRVEPGEIEAALRTVPGVVNAVVIARTRQSVGKELIAYVAAPTPPQPSVQLLREALVDRLPAYMVPAAFVVMEALPLTPNGKVDHRALPEPERQVEQYRGPRTREEQGVCDIFAEVLDLPRVGIDDNFFELGGHSLLATRVVSRVRSRLGVDLALRDLFMARNVSDLAVLIQTIRFSTGRAPASMPGLEVEDL